MTTLAAKARKHPRGALRIVSDALEDIDQKLGETVELVKRGEVDVRDLEWESELDSNPPHKVG